MKLHIRVTLQLHWMRLSDDAEPLHLHIVKDDWDIAFLIDSGELHKIYKQCSSNDVYDYAVNNIKQWLDSRCAYYPKLATNKMLHLCRYNRIEKKEKMNKLQ